MSRESRFYEDGLQSQVSTRWSVRPPVASWCPASCRSRQHPVVQHDPLQHQHFNHGRGMLAWCSCAYVLLLAVPRLNTFLALHIQQYSSTAVLGVQVESTVREVIH